MRRTLAFALLVALVVAGAGCAKAPTAMKTAPPKADHDVETGGVEGLVIDDEYRPVASAFLQIIGGPSTNATEEGRFAFSNLAPTEYLVIVKKQGFLDGQFGVQVPIGNVTRVEFVLRPVPPPVPYADASYTFNGVFRYGYAIRVQNVAANSSGGSSSSAMPTDVQSRDRDKLMPKGDWATILIEAEWVTASNPPDWMALRINFPQKLPSGSYNTAEYRWVKTSAAPLQWRIDRPEWDAMREENPAYDWSGFVGMAFQLYLAPDPAGTYDVGIYPDQKFTLYGSIGYNAPLPDDYSRLSPP